MFLFVDVSEKNSITLKLYSTEAPIDTLTKTGDRKLSEQLLFFIDQFLKEHSLSTNKLEGIIAVDGPGAFTSLRLVATTINTLSQLQKIPTYSAHKDELDSDEHIINSTSKVSVKNSVTPYYDREPNITINN